jgi:hypothetical protein
MEFFDKLQEVMLISGTTITFLTITYCFVKSVSNEKRAKENG